MNKRDFLHSFIAGLAGGIIVLSTSRASERLSLDGGIFNFIADFVFEMGLLLIGITILLKLAFKFLVFDD